MPRRRLASPRLPRLLRELRGIAALAAAVALAAGCARPAAAGEEPDPRPAATGTYVFEVEHVNYAWGARREGFHVDADGTVWRYKGTPGAGEDRGGPVSGSALAAKYAAGREPLRDVGAAEVARRAAEIGTAEGALDEPLHPCADFGTITFRAYRHDAATDTYRPVLLHQAGDVAVANRAPAALALTAWLRSLDPRFGANDCEPRR